jgi:hypothetical protein
MRHHEAVAITKGRKGGAVEITHSSNFVKVSGRLESFPLNEEILGGQIRKGWGFLVPSLVWGSVERSRT